MRRLWTVALLCLFVTSGAQAQDTAYIQGILNTALAQNKEAIIPARATPYMVNQTLRLYKTGGGRHYTGIRGEGMQNTRLVWNGPAGIPMLEVRAAFQCVFEKFSLEISTTASRPSHGLYWPASATWNAGGRCTIRDIYVVGPRVGMFFGGPTHHQVSENTLIGVECRDCPDAGFYLQGFNVLNFLFLNCTTALCQSGWIANQRNNHQVLSSSVSACTVGYRTNTGGKHTIRNMRVENSQRLFEGGDFNPSTPFGVSLGAFGAGMRVTLEDCEMSWGGGIPPTAPRVRLYNPGPTIISNCSFQSGYIEQMFHNAWFGQVVASVCSFPDSDNRGVVVVGAGTAGTRGQVLIQRSRIQDFDGTGNGVAFKNADQTY